jgi:hypothetical protein
MTFIKILIMSIVYKKNYHVIALHLSLIKVDDLVEYYIQRYLVIY